jgi:long-chain acyl-CoA synthetase
MKRTLVWPLERAAQSHSGNTAVIDGEVRFTYGELRDRVVRIAAGLRELGVRPGQVVGTMLLNSHRHLEVWFAIPGGGLVLNDLNYRLAPAELDFIVRDCDTVALIVDDAFLEVGRRLRDACSSPKHLIYAGDGATPDDAIAYEALAAAEPRPLPSFDEGTLAAIFYTGGTTGLPKGAMLSHGNLLANAQHGIICIRYTPSDRYLHAAPMFHLADGSVTYALTWCGGAHMTIPRFDPVAFCGAVESERITFSVLVPTMLNMVVNHPVSSERDLSSLRLIGYGAAPMPGELQRRAMEVLRCDFTQLYGMTEAAPLVTQCTAEDHRRGMAGEEPYRTRLASAGSPIVGVQAEVRRDDGVTRAPPGEPGEIYVRGPNVMMGYWNRPQETAEALTDDGWYRTGDVAYADEDDYLFIVDRAKDMIISGGENIYTTEVENAIYEHPAVLEAAVIGVPSEKWGESVHAVITVKPESALTAEEVIAHCRERIAAFKVPSSVELRREPLPKSGAGKILKRELREPFWTERQRGVN